MTRSRASARRMKRIALGVVGVLLVVGSFFLIQQLTGNFHEVIPHELFRSNQPSGKDLLAYQKRYGIRSVLNLRGDNSGAPWYDDALHGAQQAGMTYLNFRMSASRELTQQEAKSLIALMRDAPKPLLIHCRSGADRTGLAVALYLAAIAKQSPEEVRKQLSVRYGHLSLVINSEYAMDRTLHAVEPHVGEGADVK